MPTYDYACRECGHRFEVQQSIHDDALTECPQCGGPVRRVVAAVGVQFKGSGFYRNDSRAGNQKGKPKTATKDNGAGSKDTAAASGSGGDGGAASGTGAAAAKGESSGSGGSTSGGSTDKGATKPAGGTPS